MSRFLLVDRETKVQGTHIGKHKVGDPCPACANGYLAFTVEESGNNETWLGVARKSKLLITGVICRTCGAHYACGEQLEALSLYTTGLLNDFTNPPGQPPSNCSRCSTTLERHTHEDNRAFLVCGHCGQMEWVFPTG